MTHFNTLKKCFLVLAGLSLLQMAYGQKNFLPGYMITLEGDTITGQLDYRNWEKNPRKINFKNYNGGEVVAYYPNDIKSFALEGEYYISATVEKEVSPTKTNNLETRPELIFETETVFLQTLILGEKSLYFHKDKTGRENFYILQDGQFILLEYKKYQKRKEDRTLIREVKKYSGQLVIYLSDCSNIVSLMSGVEYNIPSMKKLFDKYYDCIEEKPEFKRVPEKVSFKFGIMAGSTLTTLKINISGSPGYTDADYTTSFNPTGGVMLEMYMPKRLRRWSLNNEVLYTYYDIQGHYDDSLEENYVGILDTYFRYSHIKINTLVRYTFPVKLARFYLNAGISNGVVVASSNRFQQLKEVGGEGLIGGGPVRGAPTNYEHGFLLGLGGNYKKFFLEARIEKGNGLSKLEQRGAYINRYYLMLGYLFGEDRLPGLSIQKLKSMKFRLSVKKIFMASLGVFLLQFAYSQTNYQPGYAITTSGDTLNGLIDYRNWEKNPERISFKSVENAPEQVLGLMEIQGFSVADESYVKATVKVEVSPFKTNDLKEEKEFNFKNATAFLRAIVTGPKSLFYLKDNEGRVCMYIKEGGEYVLLEYKKYLKKVDGKRLITQNQKYVGQLNLYLQDCPEMSAKLSGIEYDPKSIEKRFRIYYECTLEEMDYFRKPDRAKSEWRVVAGAVMTTLKINANNTPLLAEADYDPSLSFAAGVSYDIFITRGQQRWSAYLEFLLTNYNIKGRYENVRNVEYYTYGDLTFAFTHLQFNPMLRYHRPIGNNHLFFNAGLSLGLVMNKKNTVRLEERFYTTHTFTEEPAFPSPRRLEQAVIGGLGFKADRLSLELRLAIGNGFSTVTGIATNTTRYFLMLGYRL